MMGSAMFAVAAMWTGYHAIDELLHGRMMIFMLFAVLCTVFGLIANFLRKSAWRETEGDRIQPQTAVTRAFDYTDNDPPPFESPRYECTMRNERFAAAFKALNHEIEFVPDSPEALADQRDADRRFWGVGAVIAVIVLLLYLFR